MTGLEISKKASLIPLYLAASLAIVAFTLAILVGPKGIAWASGLGLAVGLLDVARRVRHHQAMLLSVIMLGVHVLFLIAAAGLAFFLLSPLAEASLQIPKLTQRHSDLNGGFNVRIPEGWQAEPLHAANEIGVRVHPIDRTAYMGVAELTVRVRILDKKQLATQEFFTKMSKTLSLTAGQKRRLFEFRTEPAVLLNEKPGLWSYLVLKRFWIPLYQTSLFGLQNGRYLCSVATSGLKSHDKLARVLCLGVMESLQMTESAEKSL